MGMRVQALPSVLWAQLGSQNLLVSFQSPILKRSPLPTVGLVGELELGISSFSEAAPLLGDKEGWPGGWPSALVGDGQWPGAQCTALALPLHFRCSVQTGQCQLRPVPLPHRYNPFKGTEPAFAGFRLL